VAQEREGDPGRAEVMGISFERFSAPALNVVTFRNKTTRQELLDFYAGLEDGDLANAAPWLHYFHAEADIASFDLMALVELKRIMAPKLAAAAPEHKLVSAVVCETPGDRDLSRVWSSFINADPKYPAAPRAFARLEPACLWLGLDDAASERVAMAVRAR
jgi:hypothetical protein